MMHRADKTTKAMLFVIILLLAVLAFRIAPDGATTAQAQIGVPDRTEVIIDETPARIELLNRIQFRDTIQEMQVMDNSHVFLVRTKDRVEVYRVVMVPVRL